MQTKYFFVFAILLCVFSSVNAELFSRLGSYAQFDSAQNVTWISDANLPASRAFGVAGVAADGAMDASAAASWIVAMNASAYLGYTDWKLPATLPVDGVSFNSTPASDGSTDIGFNISAIDSAYPGSTGGQMAHLYYSTLNNSAVLNVLGAVNNCNSVLLCFSNIGPFSNFQDFYYWSSTADPADASQSLFFHFGSGFQATHVNTFNFYVIAVRNGDIQDQDQDGLSDPREVLLGTDVALADSDFDGISDFDEVNRDGDPDNYSVGIDYDPLIADTDGDTFSDGDEVISGTDPLDVNSVPLLGDINDDGIINAADILLIQRIVLNTYLPTAGEAFRADVAPAVGGTFAADGQINAADVMIINRLALGL